MVLSFGIMRRRWPEPSRSLYDRDAGPGSQQGTGRAFPATGLVVHFRTLPYTQRYPSRSDCVPSPPKIQWKAIQWKAGLVFQQTVRASQNVTQARQVIWQEIGAP
eukprot:TRINITY_DN24801_c1_g1_i2.p1 TRINITY_DN24801_c1_g1~~TRINITY_DN24801_c1_g1_i2.p1  ORF type:complete len:105 (-),score=5.13 TRINITY_DN24801_c1_g1_i2:131-445(-)